MISKDSNYKKEQIIIEGKKKYTDKRNLKSMISVNGKVRTKHKIDTMKMIRELRDKD